MENNSITIIAIFMGISIFLFGLCMFICCCFHDPNIEWNDEESMKNNRRTILAKIKSTMQTKSLSLPRKKKEQLSHSSVSSSLRSFP